MEIEVGTEFETYEALTNAITVYEGEHFVNLVARDTRTIEAAGKRNQRKCYNPLIKYSDISFCCSYGGKKYVSHSTGKRNGKTNKQCCPFSLKVRATMDGQRLFVREFSNTHNHEISEADFRFHPKQRKLDLRSQEEIATLLALKPDKKFLRQRLMEVTGKVILMKDIHNIKTRLLSKKPASKDTSGNACELKKESATGCDKNGGNVEREQANASMQRLRETGTKMNRRETRSVKSRQRNRIKFSRAKKDQISDGRNALDSISISINEMKESDDEMAESSVSELIMLPSSHFGNGVSTIEQQKSNAQQTHDSGAQQQQQQQLQNPPYPTVLLPQQVQSSAPPVPSTSILQHHSNLDSSPEPSSDTGHQGTKLVNHAQPVHQYTPLLDSQSMYTIGAKPVPTKLVYNTCISNSQQPHGLSYPPSAMITNVCTTTSSTDYTPLTGSVLNGADNLESQSSYVGVDSTVAEGQFTAWAGLDSVNKPLAGESSVQERLHDLDVYDPPCAQPSASDFPSVPAPNHSQRYLQTGSRGGVCSLAPNAGVLQGAASVPPLLAVPQSHICGVQQLEPQQHGLCHHQQVSQQNVDPQSYTLSKTSPAINTQVSQQRQLQQHVNPQSCASFKTTTTTKSTKKKCRREGITKAKKSSTERDKDKIMKKYFQQATVNLFFNERLKFPGNKLFRASNSCGVTMSTGQEDLKFNDALKPLAWLFGKWQSEKGAGKYPTIKDFAYIEEAEFSPIGMQPNVEYKFYSCHPTTKAPMHRETGFIKIKPGTNHIAFVAAHNFGVVDMQEGEVKGQELSVTSTQSVGRTTFNKDPQVKQTTRTLTRTGNQLEHVLGMETVKTAMTEHLRITFTKI